MFALLLPVMPENLSIDDSVVNEVNWLCVLHENFQYFLKEVPTAKATF